MPKLALLLAFAALAFGIDRRPLKVEDVHQERRVADPQVSPDGKWVAYTLSTTDRRRGKVGYRHVDDQLGRCHRVRVTSSKESESSPRWSPDGKWLAFLSARADKEKGTQVWLLPRIGGEATQLTIVAGQRIGVLLVARLQAAAVAGRSKGR